MSAPAAAPALPWGNAADAVPLSQEADLVEPVSTDPLELEAVGLQLGSRVEVRWDLEEEGEDGGPPRSYSKWWGATVERPSTPAAPADAAPASTAPEAQQHEAPKAAPDAIAPAAAAGAAAPASAASSAQPEQQQQQQQQQAKEAEGAPTAPEGSQQGSNSYDAARVFELRYDAYESFAAERCKVVFTASHCLVDITNPEPNHMVWRMEGDAAVYGFVDEDAEPDADAVLTCDDIMRLAEANREAEQQEQERFQALEPAQQRQVAEGYRQFMDGFKDFLDSRLEGSVVTADDVHSFVAELKRSKRQRRDSPE